MPRKIDNRELAITLLLFGIFLLPLIVAKLLDASGPVLWLVGIATGLAMAMTFNAYDRRKQSRKPQ